MTSRFVLSRRSLVLTGASSAFLAGSRRLRAGTAEAGAAILRVIGPDGTITTFDEEAIAALPWSEIRTHTRWTTGLQIFRGPPLEEVLRAAGFGREEVVDRQLEMHALNNFRTTLAGSDVWLYAPILAREHNGALMRIRDNGPLWLVFPRDDHPALQDILHDEHWIWQLSEIKIL